MIRIATVVDITQPDGLYAADERYKVINVMHADDSEIENVIVGLQGLGFSPFATDIGKAVKAVKRGGTITMSNGRLSVQISLISMLSAHKVISSVRKEIKQW